MAHGKLPRFLAFPISLLPFPILIAGCAARVPAVPSGPGTAFSEFAPAYTEATQSCGSTETITAVMSLSGRIGGQRLRGRVDAGLQAPDRMVLEATAPFGKPYFLLGASAGHATLVLPRDARVLRGAAPEAIVEALTGVALTPAELRAVLAGCGLGGGSPSGGRAYAEGWNAVDVADTTAWLRQIDGRWRLVASVRGLMSLFYSDFAGGHPSTVRLRMTSPGQDAADITLRLSDVERNKPLDAAVFTIDVPSEATPLTLAELRRAGPLGDR